MQNERAQKKIYILQHNIIRLILFYINCIGSLKLRRLIDRSICRWNYMDAKITRVLYLHTHKKKKLTRKTQRFFNAIWLNINVINISCFAKLKSNLNSFLKFITLFIQQKFTYRYWFTYEKQCFLTVKMLRRPNNSHHYASA